MGNDEKQLVDSKDKEEVKKVALSRSSSSDSDQEVERLHLPLRKIIILGDSETGKTSLLVRFDQNRYCGTGISSTVGVGYATKIVTIDGDKIRLQLWDTAGQERFRSITRSYYRDAEAMILVYDVTNKKSFENIRGWLAEIHELARPDNLMMIVGNKIDLVKERQVTKEEGERIAQEVKAGFIEASAKSGDNVESVFFTIARQLKLSESLNNNKNYVRKELNHTPQTKCQC